MEKLIVDCPGNWVYDHVIETDYVRIGRDRKNDVVLSDPRASATHAAITRHAGACILEDLGSSNGTLVNGKRISRHTLADNDLIQIAGTSMKFHRSTGINRVKANYFLGGKEAPTKKDREKTVVHLRSHLQSLPDPRENLHAVLEWLVTAMKADNGYIMLVDESTSKYVIKASRGMGQEFLHHPTPTYSHTVADTAVREGCSVLSSDAARDARFDSAQSVINLGIRSVLCSPIKQNDRSIGVIYLDTRDAASRFTDTDKVLLEDLAERIAEALKGGAPVPVPASTPEAVASPVATSPIRGEVPPSAITDPLTLKLVRRMGLSAAMDILLTDLAGQLHVPAVAAILHGDDGWEVYIWSAHAKDVKFQDDLLFMMTVDLENKASLRIDRNNCRVHALAESHHDGPSSLQLRIQAGRVIHAGSHKSGAVYTFQDRHASVVDLQPGPLETLVKLIEETL